MKEDNNVSPIENSETPQPAIETPSDKSQPEIISSEIIDTAPSTPSLPEIEREMVSGSNDFSASREEKRAGFAERLVEAFRDGVASTKPDYTEPSMRKTPAYRAEKEGVRDGEGVIGSIIKESGSAAGAVVDKAAGVFDSFVDLVKQTPAIKGKYAEAFKEGASSVRKVEARERTYKPRATSTQNRLLSGGGKIFEMVSKSADSAADLLRSAVNRGRFSGIGRKVAGHKKRIDELYIEIGRETANSWNGGDIATAKITSLLKELRQNEDEIRNIERQISEASAAKDKVKSKDDEDAGAGLTILSSEQMPAGKEYSLDGEAKLEQFEKSEEPPAFAEPAMAPAILELPAPQEISEVSPEPAVSGDAAEDEASADEDKADAANDAAEEEGDEDEDEDEEATAVQGETEAETVVEPGGAQKKSGTRTAVKGKKGRSSLAKKGRNRR